MKAVVISNCQCQPLAFCLAPLFEDIVFEQFGVHLLGADPSVAIADFVSRAKDEYDLVLAIPLSAEFGPLATTRIRETFAGRHVLGISNIFFGGLHPDLTYLGALGRRIRGPLGDYHSRLAVHGFMAGLDVVQTVALFREEIFAALGFREAYAASLTELRERERQVDVPVADLLEKMLRREACLFSVNHPTTAVVARYAQAIAAALDGKGIGRRSSWPADPALLPNLLATGASFPVYPAIAAWHGVPWLGSYAFRAEGLGNTPAVPFDLEHFITREFAFFADAGRERLAANSNIGDIIESFDQALAERQPNVANGLGWLNDAPAASAEWLAVGPGVEALAAAADSRKVALEHVAADGPGSMARDLAALRGRRFGAVRIMAMADPLATLSGLALAWPLLAPGGVLVLDSTDDGGEAGRTAFLAAVAERIVRQAPARGVDVWRRRS